jgi:hypothetical protein
MNRNEHLLKKKLKTELIERKILFDISTKFYEREFRNGPQVAISGIKELVKASDKSGLNGPTSDQTP